MRLHSRLEKAIQRVEENLSAVTFGWTMSRLVWAGSTDLSIACCALFSGGLDSAKQFLRQEHSLPEFHLLWECGPEWWAVRQEEC